MVEVKGGGRKIDSISFEEWSIQFLCKIDKYEIQLSAQFLKYFYYDIELVLALVCELVRILAEILPARSL